MSFPSEEKIVDAQSASQYMLALTKSGDVYSWGKNTGSTCEVCVCVRVCVCVCVHMCVCVCVCVCTLCVIVWM